MTSATRIRATCLAAGLVAVMVAACVPSTPFPAALDTRSDTCGHCRMAVSDARFAAQIVAPGEEPRFFDDIGCLRAYLEASSPLSRGSGVFVASYATKAWLAAREAAYLRSDRIATPMGFNYVAFENATVRDRDPAAAGGQRLSAADLFGTRLPEGERP